MARVTLLVVPCDNHTPTFTEQVLSAVILTMKECQLWPAQLDRGEIQQGAWVCTKRKKIVIGQSGLDILADLKNVIGELACHIPNAQASKRFKQVLDGKLVQTGIQSRLEANIEFD